MFLINNHQATYINVKNSLKKYLKTLFKTMNLQYRRDYYCHFKLFKICLFLWRHLEINSVLLFNKPLCSDLTIFR